MDVQTGAMASLLPKLKKLLKEEYKLHTSVRKDVQDLISEMERMQAGLLKLAEVPRDQLDEEVKLWVKDVKELSYSTEVVVDKLLTLAPNSEGYKGLMEKMGRLLKKGKTRHQIITDEINSIKTRVQGDRYKNYNVDANYTTRVTINPRLAAALSARRKHLVGIHGKKDQELMKLLSDGGDSKKLKVVSVVGFGGSGKTTLVKTVYDKIEKGFDCKTFVVSGQNGDAKQVFRGIINKLTINNSCNIPIVEDAQAQHIEKLREILENKRYLIVIDDIWDETLWEDIIYAFSNENNLGSRIITTTRKGSVCKACCLSANDSIYQMKPLSDDDSKKLLYDRTFGSVSKCPHEFEQVSGDILKKCGGAPLAIIAMASVLAGNRMKSKVEWHSLLKSIGFGHGNECWENMRRILSFSYNDLTPHLKSCLLYLSTFSGSHVIERYRLVKKWIAEGIVTQETQLIGSSNKKEAKSSHELSLEEIANQYLDELVNSNVIHPLECNNNGQVISYHIHPMMHDILRDIAIEETFAASLDGKDISGEHRMNFRHLSIDCSDSENLIDLSSKAFEGDVHSLTVFGHANRCLFTHFKGVQVLDLENCKSIQRVDVEYICSMVLLKQLCLAKMQIAELPPQIGNLQNLEGLDVRGTQITELPQQIAKLQHLKTLDVGETQIIKLPPQIGNLKYLEVLDVGGTQITELPPQIVKLQHLKTLDIRKSRLQEIPDRVLRLTGLVHLLIGDNESSEGVKLPDGIGKMTSLQQLCTIDLRKCSASSLKELGELPYLKDIAVISSGKV